DPAAEKRYYNGKIGRISKISNTEITVLCSDDEEEIAVKPLVWENIKYTLNQENSEIEEEVIGKFEQYPLKTAWAITIHKSQGLTFERAIIDAQAAFAHGQVYVGLSRCKTFEGMVLSSPVGSGGVATDAAVLGFDEQARNNPPSEEKLREAKIGFQQKLLVECFDFQQLRKRLGYFVHLLAGNDRLVHVTGVGITDLEVLEDRAVEDIFLVSENFRNQLNEIFAQGNLPESDPYLQERARKASGWFLEKFTLIFGDTLSKLHIETDNKELEKKINNVLNNLKLDLAVKLAGVRSCKEAFAPSGYLRAVAAAEVNFVPDKAKKSQVPEYSEADVEHPELFNALKAWRTKKANELDLPHFQILHQRVLIQIAIALPKDLVELRKIHGVGKMTVRKYGEELVGLVGEYCAQEKETGLRR
ncbi:MAG: helicase, partial [Candidatus Electrothrix sp. ATG1]|nr:helicase [Candidatus Electrothrix sp. ATG1]